MPFELTPAEEMARKIAREYCEKYIIPRRHELMTNDQEMWDEEARRQTRAGLHLHIVPRYPNEAGFMDILSETRTIVEDPKQTIAKLRRMFKKLSAKPPQKKM